jgi:YggT family protein
MPANPPLRLCLRARSRYKAAATFLAKLMPHTPVVWIVLTLLDIYFWVIVAAVVASWLAAFGVINTHNHFVRRAVLALDALTAPVLRPIRRVLPAMGGLDLSPLVACLAIGFIEYIINYYTYKYGY